MTDFSARLLDRLSSAKVLADDGQFRTAAAILTQMAAELIRQAQANEIATDGETFEDKIDRDGLADHQRSRAAVDYRQQVRKSPTISSQ